MKERWKEKSISIKEYLDLIANELECIPTIEVSPNRINNNEINDLDRVEQKILKYVDKYYKVLYYKLLINFIINI